MKLNPDSNEAKAGILGLFGPDDDDLPVIDQGGQQRLYELADEIDHAIDQMTPSLVAHLLFLQESIAMTHSSMVEVRDHGSGSRFQAPGELHPHADYLVMTQNELRLLEIERQATWARIQAGEVEGDLIPGSLVELDAVDAKLLRDAALIVAEEGIDYTTCPYYTKTGDRLCSFGCHEEPVCITGGPHPMDEHPLVVSLRAQIDDLTAWQRAALRAGLGTASRADPDYDGAKDGGRLG